MDDYSLVSLGDSKNEWCARLVNTLTPCVIEGLKSIFEESWTLCVENNEENKYLMTFQTFLSRIPKWNSEIINKERKRIEETSGCSYLEDLITCVHVIQLKALTCVRVGQKQKKVDIDIPSVDVFIHRVYENVARKLYTSVYLFEKDILPLQIQRHNRELESIIKECVLNTVRDTMPVEDILRAYIDETEELDVTEEVVVVNKEPLINDTLSGSSQSGDNIELVDVENVTVPVESVTDNSKDLGNIITKIESEPLDDNNVNRPLPTTPSIKTELSDVVEIPSTFAAPVPSAVPSPVVVAPSPAQVPVSPVPIPAPVAPGVVASPKTVDTVNFTDVDKAISVTGEESSIVAPKTDERLERIAELSAERRKREEEEEDDEEKLTIGGDVSLEITDINNLNKPVSINDSPILDDIEVLA